jgi:hypothetical protein
MLGDEVQTFKALISVHKIIRDGHPTVSRCLTPYRGGCTRKIEKNRTF